MKFSIPRKTPETIVHADDFGISPGQSERILACAPEGGGGGALNSLSVIVTGPRFRECAALLRARADGLLVGLHVNLVEGRCAADPGEIPLLVDERGMFDRGFAGLLLMSLRHPKEARSQVAAEIGAQLRLFLEAFPECRGRMRVDSHQHFHMIPAVFDGLSAALDAQGCAVEYVRVPAEPLAPFLKSRSLHLVPAINCVKRVLLKALWQLNRRKVPGIAGHTAVFCGIGFSGSMTCGHVGRVLGRFEEYAASRGMPVEFLFHPGGVESADECLNPELPGFVRFYSSSMRAREAEAIGRLADGF